MVLAILILVVVAVAAGILIAKNNKKLVDQIPTPTVTKPAKAPKAPKTL